MAGLKKCRQCKNTFPLEEFYKNKKSPDGRDYRCGGCERERQRQRREDNPEYNREHTRLWRLRNPERVLELASNWRQNNPERIRVIKNRYRAINWFGVESNVSHEDLILLAAMYGMRCMACGTENDLTWDHIISMRNGGKDIPENLQILCRAHNSSKGSKTIDYRPKWPGFDYQEERSIDMEDYEKAVKALEKAAEKVRKLGADVRVSINPKTV